jgi:hypothetical protein
VQPTAALKRLTAAKESEGRTAAMPIVCGIHIYGIVVATSSRLVSPSQRKSQGALPVKRGV